MQGWPEAVPAFCVDFAWGYSGFMSGALSAFCMRLLSAFRLGGSLGFFVELAWLFGALLARCKK